MEAVVKASEQPSPPKRILILTSSGGSGHIQAASAKRTEILQKHPDAIVYSVDMMQDWLGRCFGKLMAESWNRAQRSENLLTLRFFSHALPLANILFFSPIFFAAMKFFLRKNIDCIVDTQPMGTSAILKAIRMIHKMRGKKIILEKVITDLPTKEATHFLGPIKKLSEKDLSYLKIYSAPPLEEPNFWKMHCNLDSKYVQYTMPIRKMFTHYTKKPIHGSYPLRIEIPTRSPEETHVIHQTISLGSLKAVRKKGALELFIKKSDKVALLMLGGNPCKEAIFAYIRCFIQAIREKKPKHRKDHLFIFCSHMRTKNKSLQKQILQLIQKEKNYPESLSIIPLSHQEDNVLAPILHRSDVTLTRSGGLTAMELLSSSKGKIWIHKGLTKKIPFYIFNKKQATKSTVWMPRWEHGNALYLQQKRDAKLVCPENFFEVARDYF